MIKLLVLGKGHPAFSDRCCHCKGRFAVSDVVVAISAGCHVSHHHAHRSCVADVMGEGPNNVTDAFEAVRAQLETEGLGAFGNLEVV